MATTPYQEWLARAQELRERLARMQRWFDENAASADPEGLRWRKERFEAAKREYEELLQIIRAYGKGGVTPVRENKRGGESGAPEDE